MAGRTPGMPRRDAVDAVADYGAKSGSDDDANQALDRLQEDVRRRRPGRTETARAV